MGGMVLETNMSEIMLRIEEQGKIEKEEVTTLYWIIEIIIDKFVILIYNARDLIV